MHIHECIQSEKGTQKGKYKNLKVQKSKSSNMDMNMDFWILNNSIFVYNYFTFSTFLNFWILVFSLLRSLHRNQRDPQKLRGYNKIFLYFTSMIIVSLLTFSPPCFNFGQVF